MKRNIKQNTRLILGAMCMAIAEISVAATNTIATNPAHEHPASAVTLQLDAGKKWQTDVALRQAMSNIRRAMDAALNDIHANRLSAKGYGVLAKKIEHEVGNVVANCKLETKADAQLHLIIAELLDGAAQMAGKASQVKRQDGAVWVIGAMEKYGAYFDDAGFKPISH